MHEVIRRQSLKAAKAVKAGQKNPLLELLGAEKGLAGIDLQRVIEDTNFVGRAPEQVDEFLAEHVEPVLTRYAADVGDTGEIRV